jgi:hypothetical protein
MVYTLQIYLQKNIITPLLLSLEAPYFVHADPFDDYVYVPVINVFPNVKSWTLRPLNDASLGGNVLWTTRPLLDTTRVSQRDVVYLG